METRKAKHGWLLTIIFTIISVAYLYPIALVFINSFKKKAYISKFPFKIPTDKMFVGLENYVRGIEKTGLIQAFGWSLFITIGSVAVIILCCSMCAWYISRVHTKVTKAIYVMCLFAMVVPFQMEMYTLSKIANDLRLMSSGPRAGFGEINLPAKQNGSSIMPGKVNPVIPEVVNQVAFNAIGNDMTITMAAEAGQLELNAYEPIIFYCLFQSIDTIAYAVNTFVDNCVIGITANETRCRYFVENSVGIITAICPYVGYQKAAEIAKEAIKTGESVRKLIIEKGLLTKEQMDEIMDPVQMTEPGISGKTVNKI